MARKLNNVIKNTIANGESNTPRKLKNVTVNSSSLYNLERSAEDSYKKLQEYSTRRKNNEYMTSDELAGYRKARTDYNSVARRLNDLTRAQGGSVDIEADKQRYDWLDALGRDLDNDEKLFSGFKDAEEYGRAVKEYAIDEQYRTKYQGKSYTELQRDLEVLKGKTELKGFTPSANGNITASSAPSPADIAEYQWLRSYAESVKAPEDYQNDIYGIDVQIKQIEDDIAAYDSWKLQTGEDIQNNYREFANKYGTKAKAEQELALLKKQKANYEAKIKYGYLAESEDFEEYSAKGASIENPTMAEAEGKMTIGKKRIGGKEVGNIVTYSRDNVTELAFGEVNGSSLVGKSIYNLMYDDEVDTYNYLLAKYGKEEAQVYLDSLEEELNYRHGTGIGERTRDIKNPIARATATGMVGATAGLDQWASGMKQLGSEEALPTSAMQYASGYIREDIDSVVGKGVYDLVTTTANMAPSILVSYMLGGAGAPKSVAQIAGGVTLGASAAGNAYAEAKRMGYTTKQARNYGVLVGASETALQYILGGISSLGGSVTNNIVAKSVQNIDNALLKFAVETGINMAGEGTEEYLQEILDPVFRNLMLGEDNKVKLVSEEAAYSFLLGALSAGLIEGGGTAIGKVSQNNYYKDIYGDSNAELVNESLEIDPEYSFGEKMKARLDKGKKLTGNQIGNLVEHNDSIIRENEVAAISQRLTELGENGNINEIASAIVKREAGEELTRAERKLISKSMYGEYVATERTEASSEDVRTQTETESGAPVPKQTSEAMPTAVPTNTPAVNANTENTVLQSNAVKGDVVTTATDKQGKDIGVIGYNDNGELVTTEGIAPIEDLKFEEPAYVDVIEDAKAYKGAENLYIQAFSRMPNNVSTAWYGRAFNNFFTAGSLLNMGIEFEGRWESDKNVYSGIMSKDYAKLIFETARKLAIEKRNVLSRERDAEKRRNTPKKKKNGKVHNPFDNSTLTERQRISVETVERIAEAIGAEVYFYASYLDENRNRVYKNAKGEIEKAPNGFYDPKDGSIHLDINAGDTGKSLILYTAAHELTHLIKDMSAVKFDTLADFLMEQYHKKGVDIAELIDEQIENARKNGREIDYDTAYEEVVADSMETMLADGRVVEKLGELRKKDKSIVKKIADYFKELADKIRAVYEKMTPESREGQLVAEMVEETERLQDLFFDALKDVAETGVVVSENANKSEIKYKNRNFSYSELVSKKDLEGTIINNVQQIKFKADGSIDIDDVIKTVRSKCNILKTNSKEPTYYCDVPDINRNVEITRKGITHGFIKHRSKNGNSPGMNSQINARVALELPQILGKSIEVNRLKSRGNIDINFSRVMLGTVGLEDSNGKIEYYAVRMIVEERVNQNPILAEANILGKLYAPKAKKIGTPQARVANGSVALTSSVPYVYSVADLLHDVKGVFDNTFSDDVYNHFGIKRKGDDFSQDLLYSTRASSRSALVFALETLELNEEERMLLGEYKDSINILNETDKKLSKLRRQMDKLRYKKGKRTVEDAKALEALKSEAETLVDLVDLHDKKLLELEATSVLKKLVSRERYQAKKEQKAEDKAKEQRARERREITLRKSQIVRMSETLRSKLEANTKARNIKDPLKGLVKSSVSLAKTLFSDVQENDDIIRDEKLVHLTAAEQSAVEYYRELLDKRANINQGILAIEKDSGLSKSEKEAKLKEFRKSVEKEREFISGEISKLNDELSNLFEREKNARNKREVAPVIEQLIAAYKEILSSGDNYLREAMESVGAEVISRLEETKRNLGTVVVSDITLEQAEEIYDAFVMVRHCINTADELFLEGKKVKMTAIIQQLQSDISRYGKPGKDKGVDIAALEKAFDHYTWQHLKPAYAFERLGSAVGKRLFMEVAKADGVCAQIEDEAKEFELGIKKKYRYYDWDKKTTKPYILEDGRTIRLTVEERMAIYALNKRETAGESKTNHLRGDGFKFAPGSGYKTRKGIFGKWMERTEKTDPHQLTEKLISEICGDLTADQKAYADEFINYLSTELAAYGNKVSMELYGIKLFTEHSYFPIMTVKDFIAKTQSFHDGKPTQTSLKNTGMTNRTQQDAKNPIVLMGFTEACTEHVALMARYSAYVLPIENIQRAMNAAPVVEVNGEVEVGPPTKSVITRVFGNEATNYFSDYITDLNGGNVGNYTNWFMKQFARGKKMAVSLSGTVAFQQPAAIARAAAIIEPKYLIPIINSNGQYNIKEVYAEMRKYAPITIKKEIGGYDIGNTRSDVEWMMQGDYSSDADGFLNKILDGARKRSIGLRDDKSYRRAVIDFFEMGLAEKADQFTWCMIWLAVKKKVAAENKYLAGTKELALTEEEYLKKCGDLFTEVIVYTQVYDSVNSRSGYMRSKNDIAKFSTSFMGEPTTSENMVYNAALKAMRGEKDSGKHLVRVALSVVASSVIGIALKALPGGPRDDDEDEGYWDKYAQAFGRYARDEIVVFNYLPFFRDLWSIAEGFAAERPDLDLIADVVSSCKKLITVTLDDKKEATAEDVWKASESVLALFGANLKNARREFNSIINTFKLGSDGVGSGNFFTEFGKGFAGKDTATDALMLEGYIKLIDKEKYKNAQPYVSDWLNDKALELAEKDGVSAEDFENEAYYKNKYTDDAKSALRTLFTNEYKKKYLDAVEKNDIKTVKRIRVILFNTELYVEKDKKTGKDVNDIDVIFTEWRKSAFEKENKAAYQGAVGTGDTKKMKQIETRVRASGFYDKPEKTLKNWREEAEKIKDAEG